MHIPIYQVDAFATAVFKGNPAAVMPLQQWLEDSLLQAIAMENNLPETAYLVEVADGYQLRWFTPLVEVDLCGHATLAAAHVLFTHLDYAADEIHFHTRSGPLRVRRDAGRLTLDFPATQLVSVNVDLAVCNALGAIASEALAPAGKKGAVLYVYEFEQDVAKLQPDFPALAAASPVSVIVSAPGSDCDVVSRFFAPRLGINEDPVTGSAHCSLVPYWAGRWRRNRLQCRQISARGGNLDCELRDGRVFMTGTAVTYMQGVVEGISVLKTPSLARELQASRTTFAVLFVGVRSFSHRPMRGKPCSVKKLIPSQGFPRTGLPASASPAKELLDF